MRTVVGGLIQMSNPINDTNAAVNGKPARKTLASQLDRLDGILDGLADSLNDQGLFIGPLVDRGFGELPLAVRKVVIDRTPGRTAVCEDIGKRRRGQATCADQRGRATDHPGLAVPRQSVLQFDYDVRHSAYSTHYDSHHNPLEGKPCQ